MSRSEKIALGIVILECVILGVFENAIRKHSKKQMKEHFGVDSLDELLDKKQREFYEKRSVKKD